jgi:hypothetical protein
MTPATWWLTNVSKERQLELEQELYNFIELNIKDPQKSVLKSIIKNVLRSLKLNN